MEKTKVKPDEVSNAILKQLNDYKEDIYEEVIEVTDKVTKEARDELKRTSPKEKKPRKDQYYKGWSVKISQNGHTKYHKVVWNRTNYQLTHLLEFGHVKSDGTGWVEPRPHIRKVEEKYKVEFVDLVEKRIREGGI